MPTAEPIRRKNDIKAMADYYLKRGEFRNYLLIVMGVYTALRIGDLLPLALKDVYDFNTNSFKDAIVLIERKTKKAKRIAINQTVIRALKIYLSSLPEKAPDTFLFGNNWKRNTPLTRSQAWRIVKYAAEELNIPGQISCHSLRKTFGYHAWKNHVPVPVIMEIYNHSSFEVTKRYLGISQDDLDKVYMDMRFL